MRLLIFPGGGNPAHSLYHKVYQSVEEAVRSYGFDHVDWSLRWPGQFDTDPDSEPERTLSGSVEVARRKIQEFEDLGQPYVIFARCFGVLVVLKTLQLTKSKNLDCLILWGSIPFWVYWKMFVMEFADSQKTALEKKSKLDGSFYPSLAPVEVLLPAVTYRTIVACGAEDKYSPPSFHNYLTELCRSNTRVEFRAPVDGAGHEMTSEYPAEVFTEYMNALFLA